MGVFSEYIDDVVSYNANDKDNPNNLAIANSIARQLRTQYAEGINSKPVILKSRLMVTQGHWKRHQWIDHYTIYQSTYLTLHIIVTVKCGLEVTQGH